MARIAYSRVSTEQQTNDPQIDRLKAAGCDRIFTDVITGKLASRPEWDECLAYLREGDVLVIVRLDRIGRSVKNLIEVVDSLAERGIDLQVLDQAIDTTTPGGRLVFHIFAAIAEFERSLIRERTMDGLAAARARGRTGGRGFKLNEMQEARLIEMFDALVPVPGQQLAPGEEPEMMPKYTGAEIAEELGISRSVVYDYLRRRREGGAAAVKAGIADRGKAWERKLSDSKVTRLYAMRDAKVPVAEIARTVGISRTQVYKYLRDREQAAK